MIMPSITRSPGEHEGSQFNFTEVLKNTLEQEVCNSIAVLQLYSFYYVYRLKSIQIFMKGRGNSK